MTRHEDGPEPRDIRLAELIASLSLATDVGLGQPQEQVLRQTVIASRLAAAADLPPDQQAAAFYVSLLAWVGCIADSHEMARYFGDDLRMRADSYQLDKAGFPMLRFMMGQIAVGEPPLRRATLVGRFLGSGIREIAGTFHSHLQTTAEIVDRLGLPPDVRRALPQGFERWDGKGTPGQLRGTQIEPVMRIVHIADDAEVHFRSGGAQAALDMLRSRSGTEFDPALVDVCAAHQHEIFSDLDTVDAWGVVIDGCSALDRRITESELTAVREIFADYADLKSPWFLGPSARSAPPRSSATCGGGSAATRASRSKTPRSASCIRASICVGASGCARGGTARPGSSSSTLSQPRAARLSHWIFVLGFFR
jgi:hypothetical protein